MFPIALNRYFNFKSMYVYNRETLGNNIIYKVHYHPALHVIKYDIYSRMEVYLENKT